MKKIEIIVKAEKLDAVKEILDANEAKGAMVSNIMGYGNQKGYKTLYRGSELEINLLPKVKIEAVVNDEQVDPIVKEVTDKISSGNFGDGKVFIYSVEDAVRVRTGERGEDAL